MRTLVRLVFLILLALPLSGCDQWLNRASAEFVKIGLKEVCGEEDKECLAAVEAQFDSCHKKYEKEWEAYMEASTAKEDEFLEIYLKGVYACIVDEDGQPYFEYDPE